MKVKKIAVVNGKGGCGKTLTIFQLAGILSQQGEKVLILDFDKQRNSTDTFLMYSEKSEKTIIDCMQDNVTVDEIVRPVMWQMHGNAKHKYYNVDCMVSDIKLSNEDLLKNIDVDKFRNNVNNFIVEKKYTWVLVDMPPSNNTLNNICFKYLVDFILIPFSPDMHSLNGYRDIMDTIENARIFNNKLNIIGVFLCRYRKNLVVDKFIREQLLQFNVFIDVQIAQANDLSESVLCGRPINYKNKKSSSCIAYENLLNEIKKRIEKLEIE